ncbi:seminal vesicle protein SVP-2-like [Fukomys damarensis]|uniref:Seminal vesicle protein SVP-2 n=1 Tax=Fukomys damarensis TaxID=885580 RepID=A0A091DIF4_FUKDA|nr:seminal vesicle protein SVP-2-like [Fukomys damarensis]KFO30248.1 Seminal vesicle protein SVP-2 [Fukomys damarensis]
MKSTVFFILALLLILESQAAGKSLRGPARAQDPLINRVWHKEVEETESSRGQDFDKHRFWEKDGPTGERVSVRREHLEKSHIRFKEDSTDDSGSVGGLNSLKGHLRLKRHDSMEELASVEERDSANGVDPGKSPI